MAGIGKYTKGAKFTLKSGNSPLFKMVGGSPARNMKTGDYNQSFESPVKQYENPSDKEKETPGKYWYKVNGKNATKEQYIKYQNKPGGDEPGKQTNDPDAMGHKARIAKDRAKLNK